MNIFETISANSSQIFNVSFFIIFALFFLVILFFVVKFIFNRMSYNIHATIYKEMGNIQIKEEDYVKKITDSEDNIFFHFLKLNKKCPVIKDKYLKIVKKKRFGIIPYSQLSIDLYYKDGKIIPMEMNKLYKIDENNNITIEEVTLTGIDYDAFNFLQSQIKSNIERYKRTDRLLQLAPYALMLLIVIAFIVGVIITTKHYETIATNIMKTAEIASQNIIDKASSVQVIPQG